jgi:hypothetical protein
VSDTVSRWLPDTKPSLRQLESVAILATVVDLAITTASRGYLVESNPVAAAIVDAGGWPVVGVAGVLAVAGAFAVLRRVRDRDARLAWVGGVALASVSVGAVAWGAWLVWQAGLPPSWVWGLRAAGPAVLVGAVVGTRVYQSVSLPVSLPSRGQAVRIGLSVVIISSSVSLPMMIGQQADQNFFTAQAAPGDLFIDFETDNWTNEWGGDPGFKRTTATSYTGNSSIKADSSTGLSHNVEGGSPENGSAWKKAHVAMRFDSFSDYWNWNLRDETSSGREHFCQCTIWESTGEFKYKPSGSYQTLFTLETDTWYFFEFYPDYSNNTMDLKVTEGKDPETVIYNNTIDMQDDPEEFDRLEFETDGNVDSFGNATSIFNDPKSKVNGAVTNTSGDPLTDATVSAYNPSSTSIAGETTTNSSGEYNLTLANGTYTVQFAEAGYAATTKSVSVAGPTTVDAQLTTLENTTDTDVADSDGDGTNDASDPDDDDDGIPDDADLDDDGDGIPDSKETVLKGTVTNVSGFVIPGATIAAEVNGTTRTTTTNATGKYRLRLNESGTADVQADAAGFAPWSNATVTLDGATVQQSFVLTRSGQPVVEALEPNASTAYQQNYQNVDLTVRASDPDGDNLTATFYLLNNASEFVQVGSSSLTNGEATVTVTGRPGRNQWYAVVTDETGAQTTSDVAHFRLPGLVRVRSASNLSLVTHTTVTARIDNRHAPDFQPITRTVSDGIVPLENVPNQSLVVNVSASGSTIPPWCRRATGPSVTARRPISRAPTSTAS